MMWRSQRGGCEGETVDNTAFFQNRNVRFASAKEFYF